MRPLHLTKRSARWLVCGALLLALAACSGLAGEPEVVATIPLPTPTVEPDPPAAMPDVALGAVVFADRCIACHGERGAADGALVRTQQLPAMRSFQEPATARDQRPLQWFGTITNGRIENMMPPWREALTDAERWAVAMYTYTLHYPPETLERGRVLYRDWCATCHGEGGRGDGPDAPTLREHPGDLTDFAQMVTLSDQHIYVNVTEGAGEMPAFADELTEDERWAVTAYTRTLMLANADAVGTFVQPPEMTPEASSGAEVTAEPGAEATAEIVIGTVSGQIVNGTAGGSVPPNLAVTIYRLDADFERTQFETTADAEGSYRIDGVPIDPQSSYLGVVTYRERIFPSAVVAGGGAALDMPIPIFELTEDPAVIEFTGMVSQVSAFGDNLEVAQVWTVRNTSDRAFSSSELTGDGRPISLAITLPVGSIVVGMPDQARYVVLAEQYTVLDTAPVIPNSEHIIQIVYLIPYDAGGAVIEQPLNYALSGPVRLLLRPDSVSALSEQLPALGSETVGQQTFQSYGGDLTLSAGATLRYEISGAPATVDAERPTGQQDDSDNTLTLIIIVVAVIQVAVISAVFIWYSRRRKTPTLSDAQVIEALVRQIAELDAEHEAGKVASNVYERQRALLKERLAAYMESKD
jgi:mono/diheme cytochrome c family protein